MTTNQSAVVAFCGLLSGRIPGTRSFFAIMMFGLAVLPQCFKRKLSDLRHVSLLVVFFCLFLGTAVVIASFVQIRQNGMYNTDLFGPTLVNKPVPTLLVDVPNAAFGFSIVAELFAVRAEAKDPLTLGRSVHIATGIVVSLYICVGTAGCMAFKTVGASVLDSFTDHAFSGFKLCLCVIITLLYPIINFPAVGAIDAMIGGPDRAPSLYRRRVASIALFISVVVVDTFVTNLNLVFGLAGSLGLGLLAYVLPCSAVLGAQVKLPQEDKMSTGSLIPITVVLLIGMVMTVAGTGWILHTAATE